MDQGLQVRQISEDDAPTYYALRRHSTCDAIHATEPEVVRELAVGIAGIPDMFVQYHVQGTRVWGVFDRDDLVGAVALSRRFSPNQESAGLLWGLFVLPRYRGTSASRLLMDALVGWCGQQGSIHAIALRFTRSNTQARRFFELFDFEIVVDELDAGVDMGEYRDLIHMRRSV